jgi:hypothetical protein
MPVAGECGEERRSGVATATTAIADRQERLKPLPFRIRQIASPHTPNNDS